MDVSLRVLSFFIDGLVSIEQPLPHRFTLIARLLVQLLPDVFFSQASGVVSEPPPAVDNDVLLAIREEVETILTTFESCKEEAQGDPDVIRTCAAEASEALLQVIETNILALIVPDDWQVVWMGVEG
jgi:hypothetical protein